MGQVEQTMATYNRIAREYEARTYRLNALPDLMSFLSLMPENGKVLEAACGYGRELKQLALQGLNVTGVDFSKSMLKLAINRVSTASVSQMDVRQMAFPAETFDGVWSRGVLHHLPPEEIPETLTEFNRVLKPGGVLFVMTRKGEGAVRIKEPISSGLEREFTQLLNVNLLVKLYNAGFEILESYDYNEAERYGKGRRDVNFLVVLARRFKSF